MVTHHSGLTEEKWASLGYSKQILNTASELNRAFNAMSAGDSATARRSIERALELLDLTIEVQRMTPYLPELLRSREVLAGFYLDPASTQASEYRTFLRAFLSLEKSAASLKDSY